MLRSQGGRKGPLALFAGISGATVDPNDLRLYFSTNASQNYGSYSNPQLDDLMSRAQQELDAEKAKPLHAQIQQIIVDEVPIYYAWYRPFLHVVKKKFAGYVDSADTGGLFYELEQWYSNG